MQYNELGYIDGLPLPRESWRNLCPNERPGLEIAYGIAPPGLVLVHSYLSRGVCDRLTMECEAASSQESVANGVEPEMNAISREAGENTPESIDSSKFSTDVAQIVRDALANFVGPHYRAQIESFERPQVLRYRQGGQFTPQADAEYWNKNAFRWERTIDRDISLFLYFNDGYAGGELVFPNFGFSVTPRAGLLVAFPSDHRYRYAVQPRTSGVCYAIVSWAAVKGSPRVETESRAAVIKM